MDERISQDDARDLAQRLYGEGKSHAEIMEHLNSLGYVTPRSGRPANLSTITNRVGDIMEDLFEIEKKHHFNQFSLHLGYVVGALSKKDITDELRRIGVTDSELHAFADATKNIAVKLVEDQ
jgi:hypothetical protein